MSSVFHEGEEAVQRRAGVHDQAEKLGAHMIEPVLAPDFAGFLAAQMIVYVAVDTPTGVWVSLLFGPPGFAYGARPDLVRIEAGLHPDDPVAQALDRGPVPAGMLVLEPMSRGRIRINGTLRWGADGGAVELDVAEVFGNCPKYIQRRQPVALAEQDGSSDTAHRDGVLSAHQRPLIAGADTFIIGSRHPSRGADASHRGGRPGFVAVSEDGTRLTFPDYHGNNMFQTLGNLTADPAAGLLFIDWSTGQTLQITGQAEVIWDADRIATWPGAERLVDVTISEVVARVAGLPLVWQLVEAHWLNPEVPASAPLSD